jgi:hypothetical protein
MCLVGKSSLSLYLLRFVYITDSILYFKHTLSNKSRDQYTEFHRRSLPAISADQHGGMGREADLLSMLPNGSPIVVKWL